MGIANCWQSNTALMLAVGLTTTATLPILATLPAIASEGYRVGQLFPQTTRLVVPVNTPLLVRYDEAERIIVTPTETAPITLTVAQDVRSAAGTILIPVGSRVAGELRPANGGTQFVSQTVTLLNGQSFAINATSPLITQTETVTRRSDPNILRGAAIGGAAAAVLAEVFGRVDLIEVIAGAGAGVLAEVLLRRREEVEVVVINPETDLNLTLQSEFVR